MNPVLTTTLSPDSKTKLELAPEIGPCRSFRIDRRHHRRFDCERPIELIPVGLDGTLNLSQRLIGRSRDISVNGLAVDVPVGDWHLSQELLLGMHWQDTVHYAGIVIRRVQRDERSIFLGAEFGGIAHELIGHETLLPTFDPELLMFVLPQSPTVFESWTQAGVVTKTLLDRILVCPRCCGVPTVRNACRKCGSGRTCNDRLIHHFQCAYVGLAQEFDAGHGAQVCPKCQATQLVIGADFEFLTGQNRCQSCGWRDSEKELHGHCLRCDWRFELHQAREQELQSYHVRRLAPLAILAELA